MSVLIDELKALFGASEEKPVTTAKPKDNTTVSEARANTPGGGLSVEGEDTPPIIPSADPRETERLQRLADRVNNRLYQSTGIGGIVSAKHGMAGGLTGDAKGYMYPKIETEDMRKQGINRELDKYKRQAEIKLGIDKRTWDELGIREKEFLGRLQNELAKNYAYFAQIYINQTIASQIAENYTRQWALAQGGDMAAFAPQFLGNMAYAARQNVPVFTMNNATMGTNISGLQQ